jgi:hypothetical protein
MYSIIRSILPRRDLRQQDGFAPSATSASRLLCASCTGNQRGPGGARAREGSCYVANKLLSALRKVAGVAPLTYLLNLRIALRAGAA